DRPRRPATVVGFAPTKIYVVLDHPPIDLRVSLYNQGKQEGGAWLKVTDDGTRLARRHDTPVVRLGDLVRVIAADDGSVVVADVAIPLRELGDTLIDRVSAAVREWLPRFCQRHGDRPYVV